MAEYDVALSFAGEDRRYVERVAVTLHSQGVRVFYDAYERADLWGKDLYQHLDHVYREAARYCVIFISAAYASKLWTRHELRSAQARAFQENHEYILPVRFDDTDLPGVLSTIGYVDLRSIGPEELAHLLLAKLARPAELPSTPPALAVSAPSLSGRPVSAKRGNLVRANLLRPTRTRS